MRDQLVFSVGGPRLERPIEIQMQLDPSQFSQKLIRDSFETNKCYEPLLTNQMALSLGEGDTFIDVGAHVGLFTLIASALVGMTGKVFAFEPEPNNFRHLLEHIELNKRRNIFPIHAALSDRVGIGKLQINSDNDGGHAFYDVSLHPMTPKTRENLKSVRVPLMTLDSFPSVPTKLIKIDAEGSEHLIIKGGAEFLKANQWPNILAEINRFALEQMGSGAEAFIDDMAKLGYSPASLEGDARLESMGVFNLVFRHDA